MTKDSPLAYTDISVILSFLVEWSNMTTFGTTEGVNFVAVIPVISGLAGNHFVQTKKDGGVWKPV